MAKDRTWRDGIAIGVVVLIMAIASVLGIAAALYFTLKHGGRSDLTHDYSNFVAKPNSTSNFLDNRYSNGADMLEIPARSGRFLGSDAARTVLAVNLTVDDGQTGSERFTLAGYDAKTKTKIYEVDAFDCADVSEDGIVYCSSDKDSVIRGLDVRTGEEVQSLPMHASRAQVRYLGKHGDTTILHIGHSSVAEASMNQLVGVHDGATVWHHDLPDQTSCQLISDGAVAFCQRELTSEEIAADPEWSGTNTRVVNEISSIDTNDGSLLAQSRDSGWVHLMSDGWFIRHLSSVPESKADDPPAELTAYRADGTEIEHREKAGRYTIHPYGWGGNTTLYPYEAFREVAENGTVVVNAKGEVVYQQMYTPHPQGPDDFARVGERKVAFQFSKFNSNLHTVSEDGHMLLLSLYNSAHPGMGQYQLYDVRKQEDVLSFIGQRITDIYVLNGLLAVNIQAENPQELGKLVVCIPRG
ncbi:hypothetical protein [Corynebacterium sp.]|uniref:hypothetical protein n=1 Tax=Corynebacterium sp. TaxID=1720 RepID=UPI0026DD7BFA|nr:hypothetical protein [Corynebacterium sp.]MDO5076671.1 hypothetical protein [Corynebacterium sp.]